MVKVDVRRHEVTVGNKEIKLAPKEFLLLKTLLVNKGFVMARPELFLAVWGRPHGKKRFEIRTIDQHIARLRAKIGAGAVLTVSQFGYKVVAGSIQ